MKWPFNCRRCSLPFADPDIAVCEEPSPDPFKAKLSHAACVLCDEYAKDRVVYGVSVLDSSRNGELDRQVKEFTDAIYKSFDGNCHGTELDLSEWPLVSEIVLAQQDLMLTRRQ